jgi:hypothetical protein
MLPAVTGNDRCLPLHPALFSFKEGKVSSIICPSWPWTMILLISVSQVARIISVSHQYLADLLFKVVFSLNCLLRLLSSFYCFTSHSLFCVRLSWNTRFLMTACDVHKKMKTVERLFFSCVLVGGSYQ